MVTPARADLSVFATVELSPSLVGQESKFTLSYISTVYGGPVTKVQIGTVPQTLPINNLSLEATNWGAATGGHDYLSPRCRVQWANVTGTGSFTVTMRFTRDSPLTEGPRVGGPPRRAAFCLSRPP